MSYLHLGDKVINLMAVSLIDYYGGNALEPATLNLHLIGVAEPLHFIGGAADAVWAAFSKMATPLGRISGQ